MNIINEQTELVDVRALKPHPRNANRSDAGLIAESISENGWYGQIIAQRSTGHILVGHHRLQAAQQLGATEVPVTWVDVDNTRALKIMLADNATAAAAHRDEQSLAELLSELQLTDTLTGTGYADSDLDALIASIADNAPAIEPVEAPEPQIDRAEELREKWQTERGQLWVIPSRTTPGKAHRLLCGDSFDPVNLKRLMGAERADMVYTDPPYGMDLDVDYNGMFVNDKTRTGETQAFQKVKDDDKPFDPEPLLLFFGNVKEQFWWGADYYAERILNRTAGSWIVWDKRCDDNMDKVAGNTFEMCWSKEKHKRLVARILWSGHHGMAKDDTRTRVHPTQKPVELHRWVFDHWGQPGDVVADLFLGSGSTAAACEQTGRACYGMEYEPKYVAVILERLSGMGLAPELQPSPE